MKRAAIAMSGGVDSSLACILLRESGYEVIGVTFLVNGENDADSARECARRLGIRHETVDVRERFRRSVIDGFVREYEAGNTPNPCVVCNRTVKFPVLLDFAEREDCEIAATGHYARIASEGGKYSLCTGKDSLKDQSYMLWGLREEELHRLAFPLGDMTKAEVRELARKYELPSAESPDSQDICFVPDGDYAGFIKRYTKKEYKRGRFVTPDGRFLAEAGSPIDYTVGQRRGLGYAAGERIFVLSKNTENGEIVLGDDSLLYRRTVYAEQVNLIGETLRTPRRLSAKVRYGKNAASAVVGLYDGRLIAIFDGSVRAPAPGQSLVLYDGERVVGGGIIVDK